MPVDRSVARGRMVFVLYRIQLMVLLLWVPGVVWACPYPAPLRAISATLTSVQENGGVVGNYHRARLSRALGQTNESALMRDLGGDVTRGDRRAVAAVLTLSSALANGMGRTLSVPESEQAHHLAAAIRTACLSDTKAKASHATPPASLEQDQQKGAGDGAAGLTFRQGIVRLSLTFTVYMTFLAFVIGLRRQWKRSMQALLDDTGPPPGGRAFSPKETSEISGF